MGAAGFPLPLLTLRGWVVCTYPAGSPEQCKGALGIPEAESCSSNPQQPSKQGHSASNPISATHHPICQSRHDLPHVLTSKPKSTGLGRSSFALERAASTEPAPPQTASTGKTRDWFLAKWKMGGSQRQRKESCTNQTQPGSRRSKNQVWFKTRGMQA